MMVILSKIHFIVVIYGLWAGYTAWEEHLLKMEELESRIPAIESQIRKTEKEKREIQNYLKDIEQAKKDIEIVASEVEKLQKRLPETIKDTENLTLLKEFADGLNIKDVFLSPGIEVNKGFYFTKRYEMSATGTFLQFLVFLEKIGVSERLLNIKKIELTKSEKKQRGRFQIINTKMEIEAYRYNPSHNEIKEVGTSPGKIPPPAPKNSKRGQK